MVRLRFMYPERRRAARCTVFLTFIPQNQCELASKYLPIILSVRVEATETFMKPRNPKFNLHVRWEGLISTLHFEPPYGRFVQTHPYAPIYYSWLLKNDGEGPTWEDLYAEVRQRPAVGPLRGQR